MTRRLRGPDRRDEEASWLQVEDGDGERDGGWLPKPGRSPLLVAFVAAVFVSLGFDAGRASTIAFTVAGALGVVVGSGLLGGGSARARVLASTTVCSSLLLLTLAALGGTPTLAAGPDTTALEPGALRTIVVLAATGAGVGGFGYALLVGRDGRQRLYTALRDSTIAAAILTPVLVVLFDVRFYVTISAVGRALVGTWTTTPAVSLLWLQILALCTAVLAVLVRSALGDSVPRATSIPTITDAIDLVRSRSDAVYWACLGYAFLWSRQGTYRTVDAALESLGVIGHVVGTLLETGVLHGIFLVIVCLLLSIVVGYGAAPPVRRWLEPEPIRTVSVAAGGVLVPVAVLGGGTVASSYSTSSLGRFALVSLLLAFVLLWSVRALIDLLGFPDRSTLLGVASVALFGTTVLLAVDGLSSIGVLVGVAATLVAWDLGSTAISIHRSIGPHVDATAPIGTHATTTLVVAAVGVALGGLALGAATVVGSVASLRGADATVVLLVLAVLAFATVGVGRPLPGFGTVRSAATWLRPKVTNTAVLTLLGVVLSLVLLGWAVDDVFYAIVVLLAVILLAIGVPTALVHRADYERREYTRKRL